MKKKILLSVIIFTMFMVQANAHFGAVNIDTLLILKNANVLDANGKRFLSGKDITILNGRIIKIGRSPKNIATATVIDLTGKYIIPGLIDDHVHVTARYKNKIETTFSHLNYFLQHGITSVRDAAGDGDALLEAQTAIRQGKRAGADVFFAAFMSGDWYYNRDQNIRKEPYTPWEQRLVPGDDLDKAMAEAKACGATGVKLYHSFDKDFLKQIVKAAKRNGLKTWGHTMMYPAKPIEVAQAGVQVLSHVSMLEVMRTDTLFYRRNTPLAYKDSVIANINITAFCREMKKQGAILDATLSVSADRDPWVFSLLKRVHEQGVEIAAGTDQIVDLKRDYPHLIDELGYFVEKCGFTTAEAIRAATITNAKVLGEEKSIGSIKTGKKADLLILNENPLLDIWALTKIALVVKGGRIVE